MEEGEGWGRERMEEKSGEGKGGGRVGEGKVGGIMQF